MSVTSIDQEIIWAAGFFDGEGNFTTSVKGRALCLVVQIAQVDRGVLDRFRAAMSGLGNVTGPYDRRIQNHRPFYRFVASEFNSVQDIMANLYPFLSRIKRDQCVASLVKYGQWYETHTHKKGPNKLAQCKRGHDYSNVYIKKNGSRACKDCAREYEAAKRALSA